MVVARGLGEEGKRGFGLMGVKFQFCKMERALELDGGDGCPTCKCS